MQRVGGDCQAPWDWDVIVRPSFGLDSQGLRLRIRCQQTRVLRDAVR